MYKRDKWLLRVQILYGDCTKVNNKDVVNKILVKI
jgi:hypothetical protein